MGDSVVILAPSPNKTFLMRVPLTEQIKNYFIHLLRLNEKRTRNFELDEKQRQTLLHNVCFSFVGFRLSYDSELITPVNLMLRSS